MSDDTALEAQIRADPSDVATHLVYADLLQNKGDPYGELIVLQHELAANPSAAALKKREQAWFRRNYFEVPDYYQLTWQLGFVRAATIHVKVGYLRHAVDFLRSPAFKFLRRLRIEGSAAGAFAIADDLPVDVDDLVIATREEVVAKDIKDVVAKRPGLRRLEISARRGFDGTIELASTTLEELVLNSASYGGDELGFRGALPALRSLILSSPSLARKTIAAVLDRCWPLERLGLFDEYKNFEGELYTSKVWPGLEAVGIEWAMDWDEPDIRSVLVLLGPRAFLPNPYWSAMRLYQVGQALRDAGRFHDALACFERGVVVSSDDPDMWLAHGNLLDEVGRKPESLASYRRATQLDPDHFVAHFLIAFHHHDAHEPALALAPIVKACKLDPDHAGAWHVRGRIELALGKPAKTSLRRALRMYEQAIEQDERDAESWFQLACVRAALGERAACLEALARAIALEPAHKSRARTDRDLAALRDDPELVRLTV